MLKFFQVAVRRVFWGVRPKIESAEKLLQHCEGVFQQNRLQAVASQRRRSPTPQSMPMSEEDRDEDVFGTVSSNIFLMSEQKRADANRIERA